MKKDENTISTKIFGCIALATMMVLFVFYYIKVGFSVMSGVAEWGQVGDFFGGTLGSIFGFLSFIGVLWTIHLNQIEIDATKNEAAADALAKKRDEVYKIVETIYNDLNLHVESTKFLRQPDINKFDNFIDLLNDANGPAAFLKYQLYGTGKENTNKLKKPSNLICALKEYCNLYESYGGNRLITLFFKQHFWSLANFLFTLKVIEEDTYAYFDSAVMESDGE